MERQGKQIKYKNKERHEELVMEQYHDTIYARLILERNFIGVNTPSAD